MKTLKANCHECRGTGEFVGIREPTGTGVVCLARNSGPVSTLLDGPHNDGDGDTEERWDPDPASGGAAGA